LEQKRLARPSTEEGDEWVGDDDEAAAAAAKERDKDLHIFRCTGDRETGDCSVRMEELIVGSTYCFRISARNLVGRGPWSPWTPDIKVTEECVGDPLGK